MNSLVSFLAKTEETPSNKYIFCPSGNCLSIPQINYSYNPLKTKFDYKCKCQKNENNKMKMTLKEFLKSSSHLKCFFCQRELLDDKINYCQDCKIVLDIYCLELHQKLEHDVKINENIFNYCLEHGIQYIFRCEECNESLCNNCDLISHNNNLHALNQLAKISFNPKELNLIKNNFYKQKNYFLKIKDIYNNMIQSLENDIQIKERIINNYILYKYDYNSYLNLKNLYVQNNEKYEKILEDFLTKNEKINNSENEEILGSKYIENLLSILYYSLMINKEENINNSLINDLVKKIININAIQKDLNKIIDCNNQIKEEIKNYKNNDKCLKLNQSKEFKHLENSDSKNFNKYSSQIDSDNINDENMNLDISQINSKNKIFNSNELDYTNMNFSIINNLSISNSSLSKSSSGKKNSLFSVKKINKKDSSKYILRNLNNKKNCKIRFVTINKQKEKEIDKKNFLNNPVSIVESENEEIESEKEENQSENKENESEEKGELNEKNVNANFIFNMIILKSGNIALSRKEGVEIYNFTKLDFSKSNYIYNNDLIQNNYLIQRINLVKEKFIKYVFELSDGTLLCATDSKIFRIKLTNNDSNYELLGYIKLEKEDIPTKIISLGTSFLVVLTDHGYDCKIKIFQKIENVYDEIIIPLENKISDDNYFEDSIDFKIKSNINNCDNAPAVGSYPFYMDKELKEDKSFKLLFKNINEYKKLWMSIHPIIKNSNSYINNNNKYVYEFIATSNSYYLLGKDKVAFFGLKKNKKGLYKVKKIKEIKNLSCSSEADSICQINDKYLCIGLKYLNLDNDLQSGFALIDIYKREVCNIIRDNEISCICYSSKNNLLFASMEIREATESYFATKIYKILENKDDKDDEEIKLKKIYEYRNKQDDIITSILQINSSYLEFNEEKEKNSDTIIFLTSSNDSTLEVVKADI